MKKFLFRIFIYLFLACLSTITLFSFCPKSVDTYDLEYGAKCELLKTTKSPRIIFVGGSNLAFGLDSKTIHDSLQVNVVNSALTAALGMKYIIDDIEFYIKPGDILVICPDYSQFYTSIYNGNISGDLTSVIEQTSWKNLKLLNVKQMVNLICGIPQLLRAKISTNVSPPTVPAPYHASSFNEYGDEVVHWNFPSSPIGPSQPILEPLNRNFGHYFINKLNEFSKKAKVIIIPAVLTETGYYGIEENINELSDFLSNNGWEYAAPTKSFMLDDSCAYDGAAHMNKSGVDINTKKIIEILRPIVKKKVMQ